MERIWLFFAWLSIACGLVAYFIGWAGLVGDTAVANIPTQFWFYNSIATGVFGIFFLLYGKSK